ncbi:prohibitin family protein [Swingsia samuiensis]|uniref:Prohibitin family protein n=1 Tax=Swingsia samuiensis TaxID=1293412 RepID=A0A4Y6UFL2_9PROT|nr:prohibitin family protein [Swingsia samuiensis]QDH16342.1 prohibitin family protein [Swingsia samuiensis]
MKPPALPSPTRTKLFKKIVVLVVGLFIILLINPFYQIASGYCGIELNFGSVQPIALQPGLHFAIPVYQHIAEVSTQPQTVRSQERAATHDLQDVHTTVSVTFHINPIDAPNFFRDFRTLETLGQRIIEPTVSNDVRAITANYNAEELITKRDLVDNQIKELVIKSLLPYHLNIEAVNIANFEFSPAYNQAIEAKQVAQQQALQAQYTLQQAQISAQEQVVQAKAQADAAIATAQGQAQALLVTSQAQAKANSAISQSLTPALLQQKALDRWNGTMPTYLSAGAALPFISSNTFQGK